MGSRVTTQRVVAGAPMVRGSKPHRSEVLIPTSKNLDGDADDSPILLPPRNPWDIYLGQASGASSESNQ